jgi:NADH:ubiquinone oxidoreductase subunit 6 (subunit J)
MGCFILFFKFFFLFLIWGLVYVGGIIIIFTYIVFFSNYKELKNQKKRNPSVMVVGAIILSKKFSFYLPLLEMGERVKENFERFIFLGEENFHLPLMIFFIIASVLVMVLPILKFSLNQFSQSLSR